MRKLKCLPDTSELSRGPFAVEQLGIPVSLVLSSDVSLKDSSRVSGSDN